MASDRGRPRRDQPADGWIEQVDEQQADDERTDAVRGHQQDDGRARSPAAIRTATRGESGANRPVARAAGRVDERRWRQGGRPARRDDRRILDRGLVGRRISRPARRARPSCRRLADVEPPFRARPGSRSANPSRHRASAGGWSSLGSADAPELAGRELTDAWEAALEGTGLPLHRPAGRSRGARRARRAPLPARDGGRARARRDRPGRTRARSGASATALLASAARRAGAWSTCYDVWLGAPALAGRVSGAVYRVDARG